MAESDLRSIDDILDHLPLVIPRGIIDVEGEEYQYRSSKDVYFVRKSPIDVVHEIMGTVDGTSGTRFIKGTDYQVIDSDGDGDLDSIEWLDSGATPDGGSEFYVDYRAEAVISRYVGAHDVDVDKIEGDINDVIKSAQVGRAEGDNLNRIGSFFGELGKRAGRNNSEYRALLKSIVQSFKGRGTKPGMEFAIAAGIGVDESQVEVIEDTSKTGYEIEIDSSVDSEIVGSVINEMADLADPSGVKLLSAPVLQIDGDEIVVSGSGTTVVSSSVGLGGGTLSMDGSSTLK